MKKKNRRGEQGLTLIEVMVVLLLVTLLGGLIFSQIDTVNQRTNNEEQKLDLFQEARDFMDQMTRDLHQAGYPNMHNFASGQLASVSSCSTLSDPTACDSHVAAGVVKIDKDQLWFEGDVDGSGTVSSVQYQLITTGANCPCLRRSQIAKIDGDPLTGQGTPVFYTEIQGVQNGTSANPIFYAYDSNNNPITLPVDFDSNGATLASINTIKVVITAQSKFIDPKTGVAPSVTMVSTVRLNNCSQAASGQAMSCQ